jgi:mannose-1-phosphate guanylyltransferase
VLTESHRPFYSDVVDALPAERYVEQPDNRGTAAAIAAGLARVRKQDPHAVVAVFPSDHYYRTPEAVADAVRQAVAHARRCPSQLVLVGAQADSAEGDYGWIEPGNDDDRDGVYPVVRFWEKPGTARAAELLDRGCLWNTFITVGTVDAFDAALRSTAPELLAMSLGLTLARTRAGETAVARATYARLESRCFSTTVLAQQPCAVVRMSGAGWLDVGDPERLASAWTDQARDERPPAQVRPPGAASGLSLADALPV